VTTFPVIYKDELAFSVLQRMVSYECGPSLRRSARTIFSSSSLQFCSPFPSYIPVLVASSTVDSQEWIDKHTILPAFKVFTPLECYRRAIQDLTDGKGEAVFKTLSLIANRQCNCGELRYCPQCVIDDDREFGLAYWHLHHQLPGAYSCYIHGITLQTMSVTRKRFDWWPNPSESDHVIADVNVQKLTGFASRIFASPDEYVLSHSLKDIYMMALQERGFVTSGGRLRMAELREALIRYLSPIQHYPDIASIFDEAKNPRYPACLFYLEHATHSPLKHLLLWTFLFESLYDIKLLDRSFPKSRLMDRPATNPNNFNKTAEIVCQLKGGASLRQTATDFGHTIAYVKKVAKQHLIPVESRAQRLFRPECREIAIKLMAGHTVKSLSKSFKCSLGAIEQILSQHQDIVQLRKRRRHFDKRKEMRSSLLATRDCLQKPHRQNIKKTNNKAYMWLFKNDKQWLYAHLPDAIPRKYRYAPFELEINFNAVQQASENKESK